MEKLHCSRFADLVFVVKEDGTRIGTMYAIEGLDSIYFSIFERLDCYGSRTAVLNVHEQKCMVKIYCFKFMNHMNTSKVS